MEERDYILHKALAVKEKEDLEKCLQKIDKVCESYAKKIGLVSKNLSDSANVFDIAKFSKELKQRQDGFLSFLAVRNRVKMLISRSEERIEYLSKVLIDAGIYDESFDKGSFNDILNEKEDVDDEEINLNCYGENEITYRFIDSMVFAFRGNLLDMNLEYNQIKLLKLESNEIRRLMNLYPRFVSTIPTSLWLNVGLKQNVLKELTGYVVEELKTKKIGEINKNLGSLLSFKTEITENAASYVAGVQNMIDAQTKDLLMKKYPEKASIIAEKLKCNEKSELIPKSKREAILANGTAGDAIKDEAQESEDVRLKKEKEMNEEQTLLMLEDFLNLNFDSFDMQNEEQSEIEERKQKEIANQKIKEEKQEQQESQEAEEMLKMMAATLTKHDD